ncbi:hypothetical protein HPB49_021490 [Dermacentor silvarum]|uniref:Uncharacterized protein n=1 Tax=Dermacentor silvarum TaxID=543639 RepID=A0ACB8CMW1_DERSI|nr:hypothetical protein HPB49_021490 [Dermacentor silvarum]
MGRQTCGSLPDVHLSSSKGATCKDEAHDTALWRDELPFYQVVVLWLLRLGVTPSHVAIMPDGSRRSRIKSLGIRMKCIGEMMMLPTDLQTKMRDMEIASSDAACDLTEDFMNSYIDQTECPDVDMLMRCAGARLSDFVVMQCGYAYLNMTSKKWPDVGFWDWVWAFLMYQLHWPAILLGSVPSHVAIMPDGSRRFAQRTGTDLRRTYIVGALLFGRACRWCFEAGVSRVTVFVFALRHMRRSTYEKTALFSAAMDTWANSLRTLSHIDSLGMRMMCVGQTELLPIEQQIKLAELEVATSHSQRSHTCLICTGYSSKNQMARAALHLAKAVKAAIITTKDVTAELLDAYIAHTECPDVDMLMRCAGPSTHSQRLRAALQAARVRAHQRGQQALEALICATPGHAQRRACIQVLQEGSARCTQRRNVVHRKARFAFEPSHPTCSREFRLRLERDPSTFAEDFTIETH